MENGKSTTKKVFTIIGNVIIWLFVIFAAAVTVFTFAATSSKDQAPSIGGKYILSVQTDSMSPTFNAGDIIIGQKLTEQETLELKEDDIITFWVDLDNDGKNELNSHKIIKVNKEDGKVVSYTTKGDNSLATDESDVLPRNILSKYTGTRIPKFGRVLDYLQTKTGFLFVIVLPLVLFFLIELIRFIRRYMQLKYGTGGAMSSAEEERIRQLAVEEYLRSKAGDVSGETPADAAPADQAPAEEPSSTESDQ